MLESTASPSSETPTNPRAPSMAQTDPGWPPTPAERALAWARDRLGQRETAPNQGPIVEEAIAPWTRAHPDGTGWARWCAGFASTAWLQALPNFPGSLSVHSLFNNCDRRGWVLDRATQPPTGGDIIFFGPDFRHVGLVEQVGAGMVRTIEGNAGDAVSRRRYSLSDPQIAGYARPR